MQARKKVYCKKFVLHTLDSDIQIGAVCCLSIKSVNLLYHWFSEVILAKVVVAVKTWFHNFSNFWHCSSSFFDDIWAFLQKNIITIFHLVADRLYFFTFSHELKWTKISYLNLNGKLWSFLVHVLTEHPFWDYVIISNHIEFPLFLSSFEWT